MLARSPPGFPQEIGDGKHLVQGQTEAGRYLHVILVYRRIDTLDWEMLDWDDRLALLEEQADEVVYVIHARELTTSEKRAFRRRVQ